MKNIFIKITPFILFFFISTYFLGCEKKEDKGFATIYGLPCDPGDRIVIDGKNTWTNITCYPFGGNLVCQNSYYVAELDVGDHTANWYRINSQGLFGTNLEEGPLISFTVFKDSCVYVNLYR